MSFAVSGWEVMNDPRLPRSGARPVIPLKHRSDAPPSAVFHSRALSPPMIEPSTSSPPSRASPPAILLIVGIVCVFAGQLFLQSYPHSPDYAWAIPSLGGLLLIVLALIDSVFARLPATRYTWLLLWIGAGVALGGLSESTPAAQRYILVAPAVALLVTLPLAEVTARFPQATHPKRVLMVLGIIGILVTIAVLDLRFYFADYTPSLSYSDSNTEVAHNLGLFLYDSRLEEQRVQVFFSGQPRMNWDSIATLPYLAPEAAFTDIAQPLTALPQWDPSRPAVFVFLPQNFEDLVWVQQTYPGGDTIDRPSVTGGQLYTVYLLR